MMHNSRIRSFDMLKLLAIFLVIWGHVIKGNVAGDLPDNALYRIIYSFHMPLFMMLSGYFSISSMNQSSRAFFSKKFFRLLYPCIIWGFISWICFDLVKLCNACSSTSLSDIISSIYSHADFWFLKSCFVCYTLAYIGTHSKLQKKYWVALTLTLSLVIASFYVSFLYPCFLIGMELRQNKKFSSIVNRSRNSLMLLFILMLLFWNEDAWRLSHGIPQGILNKGTGLWLTMLSYRVLRILLGIIGALSIITVFIEIYNKWESHFGKLTRLCEDWGGYTLEVYILQRMIWEKTISPYACFEDINPVLFNAVIAPVISVGVLVVCVFFTKLLYRSRFLSVLLFYNNHPK